MIREDFTSLFDAVVVVGINNGGINEIFFPSLIVVAISSLGAMVSSFTIFGFVDLEPFRFWSR